MNVSGEVPGRTFRGCAAARVNRAHVSARPKNRCEGAFFPARSRIRET